MLYSLNVSNGGGNVIDEVIAECISDAMPLAAMPSAKSLNGLFAPIVSSLSSEPEPCTKTPPRHHPRVGIRQRQNAVQGQAASVITETCCII